MKRQWTTDELIDDWTLTPDDLQHVGKKTGATRLGFAVLLKYFQREGAFPQRLQDLADQVVAYLAKQVGVAAAVFAQYPWNARTHEQHRAQIREVLGFRLLPRLKPIHTQRLYRPEVGHPEDYPNLQLILTRPINWDLIRQQYDQMMKYATALRLGTADADAILKRFTKQNAQHPTYLALIELGKAIKTIFLCEYLEDERLRRDMQEALNVMENWNSANGFIFYGKSGNISTNRSEEQEIVVLALHLLQNCLVFINTLMLQEVLADPTWLQKMKPADWRGLTPLIYNHVNPYGLFLLDMDKRLPVQMPPPPALAS